jgi:hypothetical protein
VLKHFEATAAGHLDVEEEQIGLVAFEQVFGLVGVAGFGDDLHFRMSGEKAAELLARNAFVVYDECSHAAS